MQTSSSQLTITLTFWLFFLLHELCFGRSIEVLRVLLCRSGDWILSLLAVCMMKQRIERPSSRPMEHRPLIHLKLLIHLPCQTTWLLRHLKWTHLLNIQQILLLIFILIFHSPNSDSIYWQGNKILLGTHFLASQLLTLKRPIHLGAQAYCNKHIKHIHGKSYVICLLDFGIKEKSKAVWSYDSSSVKVEFLAWIICLVWFVDGYWTMKMRFSC